MEPKIKLGHSFECKKSVVGDNKKIYYTKGETYICEQEGHYPANEKETNTRYMCGFITNNFGNKFHGWPYDPVHHPWSNDKWTDFFEEIK